MLSLSDLRCILFDFAAIVRLHIGMPSRLTEVALCGQMVVVISISWLVKPFRLLALNAFASISLLLFLTGTSPFVFHRPVQCIFFVALLSRSFATVICRIFTHIFAVLLCDFHQHMLFSTSFSQWHGDDNDLVHFLYIFEMFRTQFLIGWYHSIRTRKKKKHDACKYNTHSSKQHIKAAADEVKLIEKNNTAPLITQIIYNENDLSQFTLFPCIYFPSPESVDIFMCSF